MEEIRDRISKKFRVLHANQEIIFDRGSLEYSFDKKVTFLENFTPFFDSLENEIKSLPYDRLLYTEIEVWVLDLDSKIEKALHKKGLSETGRIFLTHRKKLKARLLEIQSHLSTPVLESTISKPVTETSPAFKDIFLAMDWKKYIDALHEVDNPVISIDYKFIGNAKKHKGVIASWIKELQDKGIIHKKYSRKHLAEVLNSEIKGLDLGKDGKTIDNYSLAYENEYKSKLKRIANLLP
jgi:hypothetical protein